MRSKEQLSSVRASALILERGYGRIPLAEEMPQLVLKGDDPEQPSITIRFIEPNHPPLDDNDVAGRDFPNVLSFEKFTRGS